MPPTRTCLLDRAKVRHVSRHVKKKRFCAVRCNLHGKFLRGFVVLLYRGSTLVGHGWQI